MRERPHPVRVGVRAGGHGLLATALPQPRHPGAGWPRFQQSGGGSYGGGPGHGPHLQLRVVQTGKAAEDPQGGGLDGHHIAGLRAS